MVHGPAQPKLDCNPENRALAVPVARKRHDSMELRFSCGLSSRVQGPEDFASRGPSAASLASLAWNEIASRPESRMQPNQKRVARRREREI
jgi:hypothetical protein